MYKNPGKMMPIQYISLFSGAGGLDEGLHGAGYTPLFCCEIDKYARSSLANWTTLRETKPIIWDDVTTVNLDTLKTELNLKPGELPLLAGGPPCQSFSLIGKRGSIDDDRGQLLYQMVRFAKEFLPKVVLVEQVKGLKSAKGADGKAGGALSFLLDEFHELGYLTSVKILKTSDYGVPQHRERLFIVASKSERFDFPHKTHGAAPIDEGSLFTNETKPYVTVGEALAGLPKIVKKGEAPAIAGHVDITPQRDVERISGVPEGDFLARQMNLPAEQRMRLNPKKDTTKFRRLAFDLPSLTLRCGEAFYHPIENRYLSPREYMRIHGFSDDQCLVGPIRGRTGTVRNLDQHRQVANAVPPLIAKILGENLRDQYFS
jgi:DNA (cytosine-5)-methyltransferase 1